MQNECVFFQFWDYCERTGIAARLRWAAQVPKPATAAQRSQEMAEHKQSHPYTRASQQMKTAPGLLGQWCEWICAFLGGESTEMSHTERQN